MELRRQPFGSPLQGVLTVLDPAGKELARAEANGPIDPALTFTAPADGTYVVRVADRFKGRGGPAFAYRLRAAAPTKEPDFHLKLVTDVVTLPRGGKAVLKVAAERLGGCNEPIKLTLDGLPAGVKATNPLIPAGQNQIDLSLEADKAAPIVAVALTVRGSAKVGGKELTRTAALASVHGDFPVETARLSLALPCPFKLVSAYDMRWSQRGSLYRRKYKIERNGFDGPIEVSVAEKQARHLQGATGETLVLAPGVTEFEYVVFLPPWMETGRTCRVCVQAEGVVKDGGVEHAVSYQRHHPERPDHHGRRDRPPGSDGRQDECDRQAGCDRRRTRPRQPRQGPRRPREGRAGPRPAHPRRHGHAGRNPRRPDRRDADPALRRIRRRTAEFAAHPTRDDSRRHRAGGERVEAGTPCGSVRGRIVPVG